MIDITIKKLKKEDVPARLKDDIAGVVVVYAVIVDDDLVGYVAKMYLGQQRHTSRRYTWYPFGPNCEDFPIARETRQEAVRDIVEVISVEG